MTDESATEAAPRSIEPDGLLLEDLTAQTERGPVYFRRQVGATLLEKLELAEGLGIFFRYNRDRQKEILLRIARLPYGNVVVAHTAENVLTGYITMHPVDPTERWAVLNEPGEANPAGQLYVYEFGAIEVSRAWRGQRLSSRLMQATFAGDDWFDDKIVVSTEFAWHWDYEELGLNKFTYRKMLRKVIASAGFQQLDTDEPNILMDPANMFMVRLGSQVPHDLQQRFFGLLHRSNRWGF